MFNLIFNPRSRAVFNVSRYLRFNTHPNLSPPFVPLSPSTSIHALKQAFLDMKHFISTSAEKQQINLNLLHQARALRRNEDGSEKYIFKFLSPCNIIMWNVYKRKMIINWLRNLIFTSFNITQFKGTSINKCEAFERCFKLVLKVKPADAEINVIKFSLEVFLFTTQQSKTFHDPT